MLRRLAPVLLAGAAIVVLLTWFRFGSPRPVPEPERPEAQREVLKPRDDSARREAVAPPEPLQPVPPGADAENPAAPDEQASDEGDSEETDEEMAAAWAQVDLDEVRKAMPDNLYFKLSSPTKDEAVLAERDAERDRWNVQYGKILSGTATEAEIRDYYDQRARLSTDYVEFSTYLLDHYGETLPARDVELLKLARRMHLTRLEEVPRKVEEAFERKRQQDAARAAWLADEAEFGKQATGEP